MSRNPYHVDGQPPRLRRSVFAFIDILGFKKLIAEQRGSHQQLLEKLHGALTEGRDWLEDKACIRFGDEPDDFALKAFTDNIVIGWPVRGDAEVELMRAFTTLDRFQLEMTLKGFFFRGAVSIGDAYVDEIAVFGEALLDAQKAESELARDPRIILTAPVAEAVTSHLSRFGHPASAWQSSALLRDSDGQWFLNYLNLAYCAGDEYGPFHEIIMEHKTVVESRLEEFATDPRVWAKYAWVAGYHNFFCDLHARDFDSTHRIDVRLFQRSPTLIVESAK